jgi:SAM-dependent methyltransferase
VDHLSFVDRHLPPPPARVLEVGCGKGDLARTLAGRDYDVTAIDPHAPSGDIFRAVAVEDFTDPRGFDAIVAIRSLHHIADLDGAVAKIAQLLRPGGRLLVAEHAFERFDADTAAWLIEHRAEHDHAPATVEECLDHWHDDHHDLHTSTAIRAALDGHFTERHFAWTPYLHDELATATTEEQEQSAIDAGTIRAMGFSYVGLLEKRGD